MTAEPVTAEPVTAGTARLARTLHALRRSLARNAAGGSSLRHAGIALGAVAAVATLLAGLSDVGDVPRKVDQLAALLLCWQVGWIIGPIAFRGSGQSLRAGHFVLLPIPPRRLAAALLGASVAAPAPALTLLACSTLLLAGAAQGTAALVVAVPATILVAAIVLLTSRVVIEALAMTLASHRGQDLGGLLMAVIIAAASGGWSVAVFAGQQIAQGSSPGLRTALRVVPTGWAPEAVMAAGRDWSVTVAALLGMTAVAALLLLAWSTLLQRTMRRAGGAPRRARRTAAPADASPSRQPTPLRYLPAGPTAAVTGREVLTWRRDTGRSLGLVLAVLVSVGNVGVPAVAFGLPALVPWVGVATALFTAMTAVNVYGADGTGLWLTRMTPGIERGDVRGRQAAWLIFVPPTVTAMTVAGAALGGSAGAWPWVLAALPAVLRSSAGLMVMISVVAPIRYKDPQLRSGPFDTGDDPSAAGTVLGHGYLMLLLTALAAVPGCALAYVGGASHRVGLHGRRRRGVERRRRLVVGGRSAGGAAARRPRRPTDGSVHGRRCPDRAANRTGAVRTPGVGGGEDPVDRGHHRGRPAGTGADRLRHRRRRPGGQGVVRRAVPAAAAAGARRCGVRRRRRAHPVVRRPTAPAPLTFRRITVTTGRSRSLAATARRLTGPPRWFATIAAGD